jgi:C4-dicarboxylate transporter
MGSKKIRRAPKEVVVEFRKEIKTLILSAFGFVAALAWNDAIKSLIETYVPTESGWIYMVLKAVIVTLVVVVITYIFTRKNESAK